MKKSTVNILQPFLEPLWLQDSDEKTSSWNFTKIICAAGRPITTDGISVCFFRIVSVNDVVSPHCSLSTADLKMSVILLAVSLFPPSLCIVYVHSGCDGCGCLAYSDIWKQHKAEPHPRKFSAVRLFSSRSITWHILAWSPDKSIHCCDKCS